MANIKTKGAGPEQGALRTTKKIEQNNTFTTNSLNYEPSKYCITLSN